MQTMTQFKLSSQTLFAVAALGAVGFALTTAAVARGLTSKLDKRAKRGVHETRGRGARASGFRGGAWATTPLGKSWAYVPPSLLTALRLQRQGRTAGALTIAATATLAAVLPKVLDQECRSGIARRILSCYPRGLRRVEFQTAFSIPDFDAFC